MNTFHVAARRRDDGGSEAAMAAALKGAVPASVMLSYEFDNEDSIWVATVWADTAHEAMTVAAVAASTLGRAGWQAWAFLEDPDHPLTISEMAA